MCIHPQYLLYFSLHVRRRYRNWKRVLTYTDQIPALINLTPSWEREDDKSEIGKFQTVVHAMKIKPNHVVD